VATNANITTDPNDYNKKPTAPTKKTTNDDVTTAIVQQQHSSQQGRNGKYVKFAVFY
ncbi:MAG: ribosomal protein L14, partial [Bacillariaceae sp.]|jgi:ribosomal protein L14